VREVFRSALEAGNHALRALGVHPFKAELAAREFEKFDVATLEKLYQLWNREIDVASNQAYIDQSNLRMASLTEAMERDRRTFHDRTERGWTPPPSRRRDEAVENDGKAGQPSGAA
jgi:CPA2 family monovalent cation:H+ antiporter-2/glutathione-regulated potassium-efflux system ancillary protein KefC